MAVVLEKDEPTGEAFLRAFCRRALVSLAVSSAQRTLVQRQNDTGIVKQRLCNVFATNESF